MAGILSAFNRRNQKKDPMRESAALTTVYLLEQNQKFEHFMRQKVDELESRVAAQQARLSTREEAEERELWAAMESFEEAEDTMTEIPEVDEGNTTAVTKVDVDVNLATGDAFPTLDIEAGPEPVTENEPEEIPDYLTLMGGTPNLVDDTEAVIEMHEDLTLNPSGTEAELSSPTATVEDDQLVIDQLKDYSPTINTKDPEPDESAAAAKENVPGLAEAPEDAEEVVPLVKTFSFGSPDDEEALPEIEGTDYATSDAISPTSANILKQKGLDAQQVLASEKAQSDVEMKTKADQVDQQADNVTAELETTNWAKDLSDGQKGDWT